MLKWILLTCFALLSCASYGADWVMPTPFGDSNPPTQVAYDFAEQVQLLTNDEININVQSNGTALNHLAIPAAVRSGKFVVGEFLLALLDTQDPIFKQDTIPFLANNYADAKRLWMAAKPETEKQLNKIGLRYLYVVPWTPYSLFSTTKIHTFEDFKGKSIRAYNQTVSTLIQSVGASPFQVPLKDIQQAFKQKKLDARFASLSVGEDTEAWRYAPYLNDLRVWIPKEIVVMNKHAFDQLDTKTQNAILTAAAAAEKKGWLATQDRVQADLASLQDNGIHYSQPTKGLMQALLPIGQRMTQEWINQNPEQIGPIYNAYRKAQHQP